MLATQAGFLAVQDEFIRQAETALVHLKDKLTDSQLAGILGVDPFNEPFPGRFDSGQDGAAWERDVLLPFYRRFRAAMDSAGWSDKLALVEPDPFWNMNLSFEAHTGGFSALSTLGSRYLFNTHFYDAAELSGLFMWGNASSGRYSDDFSTIRSRASSLGTAAMVSEFGSPMSGDISGKTPSVLKALYQSLDSAKAGSSWWMSPSSSGVALSGTLWQWDIYSGRHHEYMNGNLNKLMSSGDAWNGEDFSLVAQNSAGVFALRQDARVLDRVYPETLSGNLVAFTYEDLARDKGSVMSWNSVPSSMSKLAAVVGSGQFAVLAWRSAGIAAPTEVHLPSTFTASGTTVVSDLGILTGLPAYAGSPTTPISLSAQPGPTGVQRLLFDAPDSGRLHVALITNGAAVSASVLTAAQGELVAWATAKLGG